MPEIRKKKEGFFLHLEEYVAAKKKKTADGSATVFDSMVLHLERFQEWRIKKYGDKPGQRITFAQINFGFYEEFVDFLTYEYEHPRRRIPIYGLRVNSIGKTVKNFRMFVKVN